MNSFYIYAYQYKEMQQGKSAMVSATVIFCSCSDIDEKDLQAEIRDFYEKHYQTDKIFVIASSLQTARLTEVFITQQDTTFKGIPKRHDTFLNDSLYLFTFDKNGQLSPVNAKPVPPAFEETFRNQGLQQIFIQRGGLIVSEGSHHYVFPSGKHFDRFLRTGNILLYSPEIFFIAFTLLPHFNEEKYDRIYCDTSSINSIAFALFDLKRNFPGTTCKVSIESFSSYEGLYKTTSHYTKDSFLLVSASTSANIIKYILDRHKILERDNIMILYFLGAERDYSNVKDQVLCNLTKSDANPTGIQVYPMYFENDCQFCKQGSYAVPVAGDVFLLERPKINKILIGVDDAEKTLSGVVQQFMSTNRLESVFKVHYKERSEKKYEIYVDYAQLLRNLPQPKLTKYRDKLTQLIYQTIPANTKYFLHLMDEGSIDLANYIFSQVTGQFASTAQPVIVSQDNLQTLSREVSGTVVIVGSCISNGKNLLYISRALRNFDNLKISYFIGIARTANETHLTQLKSSLTRGKYGQATNIFVAVETIYCSNESKASPWLVETEFLKDMLLFIENNNLNYPDALAIYSERKQILASYSGNTHRGITDDLFYKRYAVNPATIMRLNKNFAFYQFDDYDEHVTQSDVFFTISSVINKLRNSVKNDRQLKQAVYIRNLLDPANFNRFNDGVIQASILRAANAEELSYGIDEEISQDMYNTLETMVKYYKDSQGEALPEFLYAIAIKKMTLKTSQLEMLLQIIRTTCEEHLFLCFADYIEDKIFKEPKRIRETVLPPAPTPVIAGALPDSE